MQAVLVDSEPYLFRLLTLKWSHPRLVLRLLRPSRLEMFMNHFADQRVVSVTVSLPQPGWSDQALLRCIRQVFPGLPVISLFPMGHSIGTTDDVTLGDRRFIKPLSDVDGFIDVLGEVCGAQTLRETDCIFSGGAGPGLSALKASNRL